MGYRVERWEVTGLPLTGTDELFLRDKGQALAAYLDAEHESGWKTVSVAPVGTESVLIVFRRA